MRRREFILALGGAAAWPAARAQSAGDVRRVGVLMTYAADDPEAKLRVGALEGKLRELGWEKGGNLEIDYRWAPGGEVSALRAHAAAITTSAPDVILCQSTPALIALRRENGTTPLVFVQVTDPVGAGFVRSLAKHGGHVTGFTDFEYSIGGKWIELLKEVVPGVAGIGVIAMAGHAGNAGIFRAMAEAAPALGVRVSKFELTGTTAIEQNVAAAGVPTGLIVLPSPAAILRRDAIITLALQRRLPAVYPLRYFAASGGMMSYGIDQVDQWGRAASYVDQSSGAKTPPIFPFSNPASSNW